MQRVDWGESNFKNFLFMSSITASILKHLLTKWYLYILQKSTGHPFLDLC